MSYRTARAVGALAALALAASIAGAQTLSPDTPHAPVAQTYPIGQGGQAVGGQNAGGAPGGYTPSPLVTTPQVGYRTSLSDSDAQYLVAALNTARSGGGAGGVRAAMEAITDPLARKIALWALADSAPDTLSFSEADAARRDLAGWPRAARRQLAAEKLIETAGLGPQATIDWFGGSDPVTGQGAMALASALKATGKTTDASQVIKAAWRTLPFDIDVQKTMLARFGDMLSTDDHVTRADMLLYGPQGQAAQAMLDLLPADQRAIDQARIAVRQGAANAQALVDALPVNQQVLPGLAYERVLAARSRGQFSTAATLAAYLPDKTPFDGAGERLWNKGRDANAALKGGDYNGAFAIAAHTGLTSGGDAADAEFMAGFLAFSKMRDPRIADVHFAKLQTIGQSPLTQSRALYWRGRAAEAMGDPLQAQIFYGQGAKYYTTFYGQLSAIKAGVRTLTLDHDPVITSADRARFEGRDYVRATRMLAEIGARDTFKQFVAALADTLPTAQEEALLVDMARGYGDQEVAMRAVRNAAKRGFILPERGYPIRTPPSAPGAPEPAFVLGITRQESSFDPRARSGPGARGMMQLMPTTASIVARRLGMPYSPGQLDDPDYNMQLGSAFLGQLVNQFSGSYVMASAAYNAGPGRPTAWVADCTDPRASGTDPLDFIECIPFSETRDYVMRVMEATQVYRARLNGGTTPITLAKDLKRGGYSYTVSSAATAAGTP
ncbi:lytic transglycosylase domain-containing protein [Caulobacter sp. KR2-114]|uniref:lytic transglycosylase domain-containing protein n=1 Tax=Caulobacter sp. KR2-114 TaxID=3400912 RepID=UPI003C00D18B